jgi:exopolysaccharide biosynthesis predicted pyruvyltransferase EpsI
MSPLRPSGRSNPSEPEKTRGHELVSFLRTAFSDVAGQTVPLGARCALLDFPSYANVGDSAIWLGQLEFLRSRGAELVYTSDIHDYRRDELLQRLGAGIALISGGGGFGDRYRDHQRLRERIVSDLPENPIVQLPQSIEFRDPRHAERSASVFRQHAAFTLLVRDQASHRYARDIGLQAKLCPDAAFALPPLPSYPDPCADILWLSRSDDEKAVDPGQELHPIDWTRDRLIDRVLHRAPVGRARLRERLARGRLERGLRLLSQGRIVITDRLHGHILSLLLGRPNVVLDTANSKMKHFVQTWTGACELTHWAEEPREAVRLAYTLSR